jgi:hypothetical protein
VTATHLHPPVSTATDFCQPRRHDVDPLVLADAVLALADGVATRMLYTRDQDEALLLALDVALSGLFQPPQR